MVKKMVKKMARIKTPAFNYPDGKAKYRHRIVDQFPKRGRVYCEPFAGAGNVFYEACSRGLSYDEWFLNDHMPFLVNLTLCKMGQFPSIVNRKVFEKWAITNTPEADVLARAITYNGWGYQAGFIGSTAYNRGRLLNAVWAAKTMLKKAVITADDWDTINYHSFTSADFVYFDPPTRDFDCVKLVEVLHEAKFNWLLTRQASVWLTSELGCFQHLPGGPGFDIWKNFH